MKSTTAQSGGEPSLRKAKLLAQLDTEEITVPRLSMETLMMRACNHYNERKYLFSFYRKNSRYADYEIATPQSSSKFLARITVNYLRHGLTSYEEELAKIVGKVGVSEAYAEINRRVYAAIAAAYPLLAEECQRQLAIKMKS